MGSRVRALSVTHVRPAETSNPPSHDAGHAIQLSLFDTQFIALAPIQRLFFYDGADLPPFPDMVRTLRSSLAATVAVFTPLAGRVAVSPSSGDDADVAIDCSPGDVSRGVRFVEAEYAGDAADVRRLAGAAEHDAEAYAQLAPALEVGALPAPALAVQVTRPGGGGGGVVGAVVVGVSMNHVVADGQAFWELMRAWAAAARGSSTEIVTPPTFDRAAINRYPKAEEVARKFLRVSAPALPTVDTFPVPDNALQRRRTYLLSASQIRSLKHRISLHTKEAYTGTAPAGAANPPTSTYAAVASLVWASAVRAKNALNPAGDDAYLMFAADCRARLRPPLPAAFFGNCAKSCYARATVGALRDGGGGAESLARAAAAVREAVREQLADPVADAEGWMERHRALPPDRTVQVGASNRFAAYETDFGWGAPSRVELASVFAREFVAVVGAPDGAVQVSVALDRGRMDGFEASFLSLLQGSS